MGWDHVGVPRDRCSSPRGTVPSRLPSPPAKSEVAHGDEPSGTESDRPFACRALGCSRRFRRKFTLKDHIKSHTGEKPFVCPIKSCRKRFTTSGNLARHRRVHPWLGEPLECLIDRCKCTFRNEKMLERHMTAHFEDVRHWCEYEHCGRVFTTAGNLRRHIKQHHPLQEQEKSSDASPLVDVVDVSRATSPSNDLSPLTILTSKRVEMEMLDSELLEILSYFLGTNHA